jgi:protein disulfide-isomerase
MARLLPTAAALACGCLVLAGPALAQRFSNPEGTPPATPAPADKPADKPVQDDPNNHRVGGGVKGFELPLKLYDEKTDAAKDIVKARERAKKDNRRVLVMWGENRCEFCAYLNEMMTTDPMIRQLIETEYEWVKVDIGKFDKNIDLANSFQVPIDRPGFGAPALCIIEPASNQSIGVAGGNEMVNQPMMPPDRVFNRDFVFNLLDKSKPQAKVATMLMLEAQQKARREEKRVLTYFNIYGSDACKVFNAAANNAETQSMLEKAFVLRKIDVERTIAGYEQLRKLKGSPTATPPWMTVLDAEGKPVAEAGKGVEFDPEQAAQAADWLIAASGGKLTAADREALVKALSPAPAAAPATEPAPASTGAATGANGAEAKK